uniref:Short/branched chain specific acyl-CoA dehydrogenase, mitochondrial n=1 Tax=Phlebotomus papatasi TaxID=29031 RepID=A0A1B0DIZ0_PHLPP
MNNLRRIPVRQICQRIVQNGRMYSEGTFEKIPPLTALTDDEQMMKDTVAKFSQEKILPHVKTMDENNLFEQSIIDELFAQGLMGIEIPTELGGSGCNFMTNIIVVEELSKVDPAVAAYVDIHNTLVNSLLMKVGSQAQKEKYLPLLAQKCAGSFALTEPTSGSDAFALKTTAKKEGSHYILNGTKMWISNSDVAGVFLVFANANPSAVSIT